ncbi:helix-turn-helix domain-containing protein [Loktanella sp. IMCC34160]|uniref:helix-turn-helix domain-containing protein n=1 Tax=Loktanella sp. IMCC34160 TaxID=2510646 RepID=UPI00101DF193|nr:helix-turn-helix domain-containing protein [Loktanella sp. IMCC34160]RYG92206.1 helix-turn-helix domain-containing protein [Loktanella sp. IMCC34160]
MSSTPAEENWYSDDRATFGDRLAAAREGAGLSQKDVASRLGVKTSVIKAWEQDLKEPRANRLQMMSGLLGVSLTWLLTGEGDAPSLPEDESYVPADISELLSDIRALQGQIRQSSEKLAQIEKRLRSALQDSAL